jgi:transglutaminase-like putative cysteine protease
VLVALLAVSVAWSLDDAALVLGNRDWTDFLAWAALGGVLAGFVGARAGWSRPLAHLIGAAFAALVVPILVGSVLEVQGSLSDKYQATAQATVDAVLDFAVRGLPLTRQTGHFLLVLGLLCWANGQFAAASVFRHGRPIGPIIVLGTVLVANMSATIDEGQIWFLVLFSTVALLLLTRLHALDERATWVRRRIGDPTTVTSLYLRGGTVFIMAAVFGSLALTATARSAPLAGFWDDARPALVEISQWLQRIIPPNPNSRNLGIPTFGQQVTIGGIWNTSNDEALEITRTPGDDRHFYWRATAYDSFTLFGWTSTAPTATPRAANEAILAGTLDAAPDKGKRDEETFRIRPLSGLFKVAFSPIDPLRIDHDTTLTTTGDGFFQSIQIAARDPYTVTASIESLADVSGGVTKNRLQAAGQDYPAEVVRRYTSFPKAAIGPAARTLITDLVARVKAEGPLTPYALATAIVTEFNTSQYHYSTNVAGVCDKEVSIVECFAAHKTGFCEHYATTMAILLRSQGIPARLVEGFLPGDLDIATGKETIRTGGAHAWVEVYFPNIGWYPFDPTGNGIAKPEVIANGVDIPIPTPKPTPSLGLQSINPNPLGEDTPSGRPSAVPPVTGRNGGPGNLAFVAITIALAALIVLIAFVAWRRGPRGVTTPDGFYASVAGIARRFGFGPRPTQTAYEYATALGDILPASRPELQTVATAKVEVAYGRREIEDDRLRSLRESYRRLRVALLRLAFRRRDRRRMR